MLDKKYCELCGVSVELRPDGTARYHVITSCHYSGAVCEECYDYFELIVKDFVKDRKGTETPELLHYCGEPITKEMSKKKLLEIIVVFRQDLTVEVEANARSRRMSKLFSRALNPSKGELLNAALVR